MASPPPTRSSVPLWRQRRVQVIAAVVVVVLVGAIAAVALAGGGDDDAPTAGTTTTSGPGPTTAPVIAPLTGLADPTGATRDRPAMSVKIDNVNLDERPPQAGLDLADVVYEEPVEAATRFLAMFHSQNPERVGPVRSTRFVDGAIVWNVGGLFVYSGGAEGPVAAIEEVPVRTLDENDLVALNARVRDPNFEAPHNLFALPEPLWSATTDLAPPRPLFAYRAPGDDAAGDPASVIDLDLTGGQQARYTWDAARAGWAREQLLGGSSELQPHVTEAGQQIAPANVIVQKIAGVEDRAQMVGEGDAWVFSSGRVVRGRWRRAALEQPTVFVDANGAEVALTPGATWVQLITEGEPVVTP
jgi:hypothetical protein